MKSSILGCLCFFSFELLMAQAVVLDPTFGEAGQIIHEGFPMLTNMVRQSNGKIIGTYVTDFNTNGNQHMLCFNADGTLDQNFGVNGNVDTVLFNESWQKLITLQPDDKILMAGAISTNGSNRNFGVGRFNPDGSLDITFGQNGYATIDIGSSNDYARSVTVLADGKILVGGTTYDASSDVCVIRLLPDGTFDTTFAEEGIFILNVGTNNMPPPFASGISADWVYAITTDHSGNIIIGVNSNVNETAANDINNNFVVVCLNPDGMLKSDFGDNGRAIVDFGNYDRLNSLQVTPDNKIIAVGLSSIETEEEITPHKIAIVKLLENGNPDPSFGTDGKVLCNHVASITYDWIQDAVLQPDGKLLCAGLSYDSGDTSVGFLLMRFLINGDIDTTFNNGLGYTLTHFSGTYAMATSMVLQPDGKIVLGGGNFDVDRVLLARYETVNLATPNFKQTDYKVYPNPFEDKIYLNVEISEKLSVQLFDASGRKVLDSMHGQKVTEDSGTTEFLMPAPLTKGVYFLEVGNDEAKLTLKIMK